MSGKSVKREKKNTNFYLREMLTSAQKGRSWKWCIQHLETLEIDFFYIKLVIYFPF
jgi:hypothetical protein